MAPFERRTRKTQTPESFRLNSMASPAPRTPSTPASQKQQVPITPNGAWKHPRFEEITRRQHATTFDERNAKIVAINTTLLVGSFTALPVVSLFPVVSNLVYVQSLKPFAGVDR